MIRTSSELSVRRQCELLGVTRSTVYYEPKREDEEARQRREALMARIDRWHTAMPFLGTRKLAAQLRSEGYADGRKQVRSATREMGIHPVYPKPNLSKRNFREAVVPYLLRNKEVRFPNQVWPIDITYIKMHRGHMYLTAVIDWFSRKIVGWTLSDTLDTGPILEAVRNAMENFRVPTILNSDRGSPVHPWGILAFPQLAAFRQSMDGKSRWADNNMIERWFRSLKTELIYTNEYRSPKELRMVIHQYIHDYNRLRPHEALDYATPEEVYASCFAANGAA